MNKLIILILILCCATNINAQDNIKIRYDSNFQYHNFNNKLNFNHSEIVIRDAKNEMIRKIFISENSLINYKLLTELADSFYLEKNYHLASMLYLQAIRLNNHLGKVKHRYKLACSFAAMGKRNEAFEQLEIMIVKGRYADKKAIENEKMLITLKSDEKWKSMIDLIEVNLKRIQDSLNFEINRKTY